MHFILLFLSILPVYLLGSYIYKSDFEKEPTKLIFKLFFCGIGSAILTLLVSSVLGDYVPFFASNPTSLNPLSLIPYVFLGIALVEESSKWVFVYGDTYQRNEFNHAFDAIVYAVFVALGFACIENILYVFDSFQIDTAVTRAILAVPGHACDGILMGYFLALAKISEKNNNMYLCRKNKILSLLAPVIAHGLYDFFLYASPFISILSLLFFIFVYSLFKKSLDLVRQMKPLNIDLRSNVGFENNVFAYAAPGIYTSNINRNVDNLTVDYNKNSRLFFEEPKKVEIYQCNYCAICGTKLDGNVCEHCGYHNNS